MPTRERSRRELYTSLSRLKDELARGRPVPMTPVPEDVQDLIDPALTPGLGALNEDEKKGLQCPIRGCGAWVHSLSHHIRAAHPSVGVDAVRTALSIPRKVGLISQSRRLAYSANGRTRYEEGLRAYRKTKEDYLASARAVRRRPIGGGGAKGGSTMTRNGRNVCPAQIRDALTHRMIDIAHRCGRSPSMGDARAVEGQQFVSAVVHAFGSWNSAKAQCGIETARPGDHRGRYRHSRDAVLESLAAWYDVHGALPRYVDAYRPSRLPLICSSQTIMRVMGTDSWPEAMRRVASLLDIHGGRYGLPARKPEWDLRTESRAPSGVSAQAGRDTDAGEARPARSAIAAAGGR